MVRLLLVAAMHLVAPPPVSYRVGVSPFLRQHCAPCHFNASPAAGLSLATVGGILRGGAHGAAIVRFKPDESRLITMMEGKVQPQMPPATPATVSTTLLRAWIKQGANDDTPLGLNKHPAAFETVPVTTDHRLTAVAFSPNGKTVTVGGYQAVTLFDSSTDQVISRITAMPALVTGLAYVGSMLAVSGGLPGSSGLVNLFTLPTGKLSTTLAGPRDLVMGIAISPHGRRIAACSYDHLVYVWRASPGVVNKPLVLKDHTDSVYSVAFSPDGSQIASASGDRTVKVWDSVKGTRLYTLSDSTAELYSVAYSPNGKFIAAGGVDGSLRVWRITNSTNKQMRSALAHRAAILRVVWSPDSTGIYTCSEDGLVKRFRASTLQEAQVFARRAEWPQAIAVNPAGTVVAAARQNGELDLYEAATGRLIRELAHAPKPLAATSAGRQSAPHSARGPATAMGSRPHGPPTLQAASLGDINPRGILRATSTRLTLTGGLIHDATEVLADDPRIKCRIVTPADSNAAVLRVDVAADPNVPAGIHTLQLVTPHGITSAVAFAVGAWAQIPAASATALRSQLITTPCTLVGTLAAPGQMDAFHFHADGGQELVFDCIAQRLRSGLVPVITVRAASGDVLAAGTVKPGEPDVLIGCHITSSGDYTVTVQDFEARGGAAFYYRLNCGEFAVVTSTFPTGVRAGQPCTLHVAGFNLKGQTAVTVNAPAQWRWGQTISQSQLANGVALYRPLTLPVAPWPESQTPQGASAQSAPHVQVPVTINGRLTGSEAWYRFHAHRGEQLVLETMASRAGSPIDPEIEIFNVNGSPVERALLRAVGRTEETLNDRDSEATGMRIASWEDTHIGDYLLIGREVDQVYSLPKGPDDDIQFRSYRGRRLAMFGTTPEYHSLADALYRVEVYPPGTHIPPNGYPITPIYYRNDDGGPLYGKDSYLLFTSPADADYLVKLADARGLSGTDYTWRLMIHPPVPDFRLTVSPGEVNVPNGSGEPVTVQCDRFDEFSGPVNLQVMGLPPGFLSTPTVIEAGETSAQVLISALPGATTPTGADWTSLTLSGKATVGGVVLERSIAANQGIPRLAVLPKPDLIVHREGDIITIGAGQQVTVEAHVDRLNGFGGRIPLDVRNLPFGVRIMDVGLNGVLITEKEDSRQFTLFCERWVKPQARTVFITAEPEGGVTYASQPIRLVTMVPVLAPSAPRTAIALPNQPHRVLPTTN